MTLTSETLKNLINEVMEEAMPPLSKKAKRLTQIAKDIEKEFDRPATPEEIANREPLAPNSGLPVSYVDAQLAKREKEKFFKDRDLAARAKTKKGFRNRGINMGQDDPGDVDDLFPDSRDNSSPEYSREDYELMYEGDASILEMFEDATLEEGGLVCEGCLFEMLQEASCGCPDLMGEAVYQGKTVTLNKPTRGDVKKFKVYVNSGKKDAEGRIKAKKVNFGHGGSSAKAKGEKTMKIRKNNPKARANFRARHNCDEDKPKDSAGYWSCKKW